MSLNPPTMAARKIADLFFLQAVRQHSVHALFNVPSPLWAMVSTHSNPPSPWEGRAKRGEGNGIRDGHNRPNSLPAIGIATLPREGEIVRTSCVDTNGLWGRRWPKVG